jgi:DNA-binding response OmpR family regulator
MRQRSVLLVDDDRLILDLYAAALRAAGFTVHQAHDAATARETAARESPALACVDGRLGGRSAAELIGELIRMRVRVIVFTNDQALYDQPPPGTAGRLIKVNTNPADLVAALEAASAGAELE